MNNFVVLYQSAEQLNQLSYESWKKYCESHNLKLICLTDIVNPTFDRTNQIFYMFKLLKNSAVSFDNICLVRDTTLVNKNTENIFDLSNNKLTFAEWDSDFSYLLTNIELYQQHVFNNKKVDFSRFFDLSVFVVNKSHEQIFDQILNFLEENYQNLINKLDLKFIPQNFFFDGEYNKLPYVYNMIDINRKEIPIDSNLSKFGKIFNFELNPDLMSIASTFL